MVRIPSNIFCCGVLSSWASQIFSRRVSVGNGPVYVRTRESFRASTWKVFSVSLYRKDTVSASLASVLKSSHCLHRMMTGGPRGCGGGVGVGGMPVVSRGGGAAVDM